MLPRDRLVHLRLRLRLRLHVFALLNHGRHRLPVLAVLLSLAPRLARLLALAPVALLRGLVHVLPALLAAAPPARQDVRPRARAGQLAVMFVVVPFPVVVPHFRGLVLFSLRRLLGDGAQVRERRRFFDDGSQRPDVDGKRLPRDRAQRPDVIFRLQSCARIAVAVTSKGMPPNESHGGRMPPRARPPPVSFF